MRAPSSSNTLPRNCQWPLNLWELYPQVNTGTNAVRWEKTDEKKSHIFQPKCSVPQREHWKPGSSTSRPPPSKASKVSMCRLLSKENKRCNVCVASSFVGHCGGGGHGEKISSNQCFNDLSLQVNQWPMDDFQVSCQKKIAATQV